MKRLCIALLCALALVSAFACSEGNNLIQNAAFEQSEDETLPAFWYTSSWNSANSLFELDEVNGESALLVYNYDNNDARWTQDVAVNPGQSYRISGYIMAEDCSPDGRGANISVLNTSVYSESVYDTEGEWVYVEFYGTAAKKQKEITVALRVGGYSGDCTGKAWFKDVKVERAEPEGEEIAPSLATFEPYTPTQSNKPDTLPARETPKWLLFAFITALAFIAVSARLRQNSGLDAAADENTGRTKWDILSVTVLGALALAVRIYYAVSVHGYWVDINCFLSWSESFYDHGLGFYANVSFCDYPPVYMILLGFVSALRHLFGIAYGSNLHVLLIKLIPILSDLATAGLVYWLAMKRKHPAVALALFALIALNPAYIVNSAAWGQVDSVLALMLLGVVLLAMERKWIWALGLYALSVLTKPQALIFGPIGLKLLIGDYNEDKSLKKQVIWAVGTALGILYAVSLPFALSVYEGSAAGAVVYPLRWISERLFASAGGYTHLTVNACNLYTLLDRNWQALGTDALSMLSWLMMILSYVFAVFLVTKGQSRRCLPLAGAALMALVFAFAPMMHERYLFPALILALVSYVLYRDRRILYFFILISVTQFLNTVLVLEWGQYEGFEGYGHLQSSEQLINELISLANVCGALLIAWTALDIIVFGHVYTPESEEPTLFERALAWLGSPEKPLSKGNSAPKELRGAEDAQSPRKRTPRDWHLHLKRLDVLLMAGVTVAYTVFAMINLGTPTSPQSGWQSNDYQEEVFFDLGEVRTFRLTYFGGISNTNFTVSFSNDAENWTEENYAVYSAGEMYRWIWFVPQKYNSQNELTNASYDPGRVIDTGEEGAYVAYPTSANPYPLQSARYVRFKVNGSRMLLNEVAFIDAENECLYEIRSVTCSSGDSGVCRLIDEQDTVHLVPSYFNGMYFDEIYHARTAYEMLNGYRAEDILEWSHPHLGKLIISLGIRLFGMTPFGWRFMGALFGALMLPVMYLLVKQLTGKTTLSVAGMLLLAFDSMHFTQTRIATVDTYAVFFIMLMYLFMIRYWKMNLLREKLSTTLKPLGLSGLCMALACASKWTGIYASIGLAVLFFLSVFARLREYLRMKAEGGETARSVDDFWKKLFITLGFCVVAFVAVPLLVYYFSYYWHFAHSGGLSLSKVWELQKQMYYYHSTLVDNHYFKTPWYEWPLIVKPMWYYSADIAYTGRGFVSSISCMGNPAVWWMGIAAFLFILVKFAYEGCRDENSLPVIVGFAAQFLPWVLVPRSTFIYHYFASVPFIILAIAVLWDQLERWHRTIARYSMIVLLAAAFILFAMFYPLESGALAPYDYALMLRWFNWYNFALQ